MQDNAVQKLKNRTMQDMQDIVVTMHYASLMLWQIWISANSYYLGNAKFEFRVRNYAEG